MKIAPRHCLHTRLPVCGCTPGAVVWASRCCGTTWPSGPTFPRHADPGALHDFGTSDQQAHSWTRGRVVAKSVHCATANWVGAAPIGAKWQGQLQATSQCHHHGLRRQGGGCLSRDGSEPHAGLRARLRAEKRLGAWRQGWHQHAIAIVFGLNPRRMALPAVWPLARTCFARCRCALALEDRAPRGTFCPPFALQGPPGLSRLL